MGDNNNTDEKTLRVRRGRVDSVDLYEVKENELDILEKGESDGIFLNFSISLISLATTGITALATATFINRTVENTFLFVSIVGITGGILLLILWYRGRKSIKSVITKIKNRIPAECVVAPPVEEDRAQPAADDQDIAPAG